MDNLTKEQRSYCMSRIRRTHTKAELVLKELLKGTYIRYQPNIYGSPDFGSKKLKIAIFIDGCFWHQCPIHFVMPKSNTKYWKQKIERNVERDKEIGLKLEEQGYKVFRFWEHECKQDLVKLKEKISTIIH